MPGRVDWLYGRQVRQRRLEGMAGRLNGFQSTVNNIEAVMPTVSCVGIAVQDFVFSVGDAIEYGAKNLATSMRVIGGGPAANAAVTVASLGGSARLISKLGADVVGNSIVGELTEFGVDVSHVRLLAGVPSPVSSVLIDRAGERTIINCTDERLIDAGEPVTEADVAGSDVVLVDLRWPVGAQSGIAAANQLGLPTVVDFDRTTADDPLEIVRAASHVIFSCPALLHLTGDVDVEHALRNVAANTDAFVAVTVGGEGVKWIDGSEIRALPVFQVEVVDTLGAGDVFHGAFAFGLAAGMEIEAALRLASATAAIKCGRSGGRDGIPNRTDVDHFLKANV